MAKSPPGRPGGQPGGVGSWLLGPWPIRQDTRNSHSQSREVSLAGRSAPPDASGQPCGSRSFVTCRRLRSGRAWRRRWPAAGRTNRCPGPDDAEHDGEDDGAAHGRADHAAASRGRRCAAGPAGVFHRQRDECGGDRQPAEPGERPTGTRGAECCAASLRRRGRVGSSGGSFGCRADVLRRVLPLSAPAGQPMATGIALASAW